MIKPRDAQRRRNTTHFFACNVNGDIAAVGMGIVEHHAARETTLSADSVACLSTINRALLHRRVTNATMLTAIFQFTFTCAVDTFWPSTYTVLRHLETHQLTFNGLQKSGPYSCINPRPALFREPHHCCPDLIARGLGDHTSVYCINNMNRNYIPRKNHLFLQTYCKSLKYVIYFTLYLILLAMRGVGNNLHCPNVIATVQLAVYVQTYNHFSGLPPPLPAPSHTQRRYPFFIHLMAEDARPYH
jgi:hypothetical protein